MNSTLYILDTDILSLWQYQPEELEDYFQKIPKQQLVITIVSVYQQLIGWLPEFKDAKTPEAIIKISDEIINLLTLYREIRVLPFTDDAGTIYSQFTAKQKRMAGTMDARIAAIALSVNGIVVTRNTKHFRVLEPNLKIENPYARQLTQ